VIAKGHKFYVILLTKGLQGFFPRLYLLKKTLHDVNRVTQVLIGSHPQTAA
jgi:hypothetical protein